MIAVIMHSNDTDALDDLVARFKPIPFLDAKKARIGTVSKVWREGNRLMADIECVTSDVFNEGKIEIIPSER